MATHRRKLVRPSVCLSAVQCNAILQAELAQMSRNGSGLWIVKPVSSSRGRGIFIVNDVRQIPPQYKAVACRYIANPLLLDRKCD